MDRRAGELDFVTMIDVLFGKTWTGTDVHQDAYNKAFGTAHVNFIHWIVTKDPYPKCQIS